MQTDIAHLGQRLREVARAAILPRFQRITASHKQDGSLITEADLDVQVRLADALARDYPGTALLGEEMSEAEQTALLSDGQRAVWVLDPLDGTSNYACGMPGFAISLALVEHGETQLGVILDPLRDECFSATARGPASCDAQPLKPFAPGESLGDCLAMIDLKRVPPARLPMLFRKGGFRSQRNHGSVALDWCWLAAGRYQIYLHGGQRLWDYAAGRLIATRAGVSSMLFDRKGRAPVEALDLAPRLALGAATPALLEQWRDFVGLPWTEQ